jgi:hypothetical protein
MVGEYRLWPEFAPSLPAGDQRQGGAQADLSIATETPVLERMPLVHRKLPPRCFRLRGGLPAFRQRRKTLGLHARAAMGLQDVLPECSAEQPVRKHEIANHDGQHEQRRPDRQAEAALGEQSR